MVPWRFIDTGPLSGPANMAVDEALLLCFHPERSMPVFRIYGWEPPALSLGRFQKAREILDQQLCITQDLKVVRRITGGGVIYHADELTYSLVCAPGHAPPAPSIKESFRVLTSFLVRFYGKLGLDPCYAAEAAQDGEVPGGRSTFCFAGRESYDILVQGRKIGGNAQRRLKNVIFQHGSIPLENRAESGAEFLRDPPEGIGKSTTALRDLGVDLPVDELKRLMAKAFEETISAGLKEDSLNGDEDGTADALALGKHSLSTWVWDGIENGG